MIELLTFAFQSIWHFAGCLVLLAMVLWSLVGLAHEIGGRR